MLEPSISRYIWTHTRASQAFILAVVALSMVPYFLSFDLPKQIINGPINGQGFETEGATGTFLRIAFGQGEGEWVLFQGFELDRMGSLWFLSGMFLLLVVVNGLFKYYINTYKGRLGERLLRRLRFTLVDLVLRFPPATFRRLKPAEVATMVKDEVEPIGGFAGEAFVTPALLGGQALTALVFIFVQNVMLGAMTAAIVAVQVLIIPRMRRRLLVLGRQRQLTARELAGRVSEIVEGIGTVRAYDTTNWERADTGARLGRIFKIRFDIYQWKFLVKFINNFLASVTPFLFYSIGGYLALTGRLDIGQLVAVIAAYKDLPGPLKELIDWDQNRQDVQVKYGTVVQQFAIDGILDPDVQAVSTEAAEGRLGDRLTAQNLSVTDDSGATLLSGVTLALDRGEAVAALGGAGSGADTFAEVLARAVWPTAGRVAAGEHDLSRLPEAVAGRAITYAGPDAWFFFGTVRDNLLYGLRHAPLDSPARDAAGAARRAWETAEAARTGNPDLDTEADWIDWRGAGAAGPGALWPCILSALDTAGLRRDILDLGLRSAIDPGTRGGMAARIVAMRATLRQELERQSLADLIAPFEPETYNAEASVLDNLVFGNVRQADLGPGGVGNHPAVRALMRSQGLEARLEALGIEIARNVVELFGDLPADHPLFQGQTLVAADEIAPFAAILARRDAPPGAAKPAGAAGRAAATQAETDLADVLRLALRYIEPRHRFGLMTPDLMAAIVAFRHAFLAALPADLAAAVEPYDPGAFIASASLIDNMLFGRVSQKYRDGAERIQAIAAGLLGTLDLEDAVIEVGLDFHVGAGGKRLSAVQRQRLALARAILRRSDFYVFNRPLSALDARAQETTVRAVLDRLAAQSGPEGLGPGVFWVLSNPETAAAFDRVATFARGALVEVTAVQPPPAGENHGIATETNPA